MRRLSANILVLSDDLGFATSLEKTLVRGGHQVRVDTLRDLDPRLVSGGDGKFDLLIVDVAEKVERCAQFLGEIRNSCPGCTVLLVSAYGRDELGELLLTRPNVAVLEKPVKRETLLAKIRELLSRKLADNVGAGETAGRATLP